MELYLLRHAIAEERGSANYPDDSKRPLTAKGARRMRRIAEGMLALELSFDVILSSPYTRARQTAEIVAKVFGAEKSLEFTDHLAVGGDAEKLIDHIATDYPAVSRLLLVGHEPSMSSFISMLVSGDPGLSITMKKGGLCKLIVDELQYNRCATLEWLLTPSQLVRLQ